MRDSWPTEGEASPLSLVKDKDFGLVVKLAATTDLKSVEIETLMRVQIPPSPLYFSCAFS